MATWTTGVANLALWRAEIMTPYIALWQQICARYDGNPHVESVAPLSETGANLGNIITTDPTFSTAAYIMQLTRLADAMKVACPHTQKILMGNFGWSGASDSDLTNLHQIYVADGFGLGGPDIRPLT